MKKHHRRHSPEAWFGAGLAFIAFLLTGAIPATVYDGYMGLVISGVLFGHGEEQALLSRIVTGGGMVLGVVATLSLYLVLGAVLGNLGGAIMRRVTGPPPSPPPQTPERPARNRRVVQPVCSFTD